MSSIKRLALLLTLLVVVASACTSDDDGGDEESAAASAAPSGENAELGDTVTIVASVPPTDHGWLGQVAAKAQEAADQWDDVDFRLLEVPNRTERRGEFDDEQRVGIRHDRLSQ